MYDLFKSKKFQFVTKMEIKAGEKTMAQNQEKKLLIKSKQKKNSKIMNKADVINFMQTYQRITQNMFKHAPKYSSIILNLNSNHQINSVIYKKK